MYRLFVEPACVIDGLGFRIVSYSLDVFIDVLLILAVLILAYLLMKEKTKPVREGQMKTILPSGIFEVLDDVPNMIYVRDYDGKFLYVNEAMANRLFMSVEQLIGTYHHDIYPDRDEVDIILKEEQQIMDSGKTSFIPEETFFDEDGNMRYLMIYKMPFKSSTGQPAVMGYAIDITDLKKMQEELKESEGKFDSFFR